MKGSSMVRKLCILTSVMAASAIAVPTMSDASTGLTDLGTLIPVGTTLYGVNAGGPVAKGTGVGSLNCGEVYLHGFVTKDSSFGVAGTTETILSTAAKCFQNGTTKITVDNIEVKSVVSSAAEASTGKVTASYVAHVGGLNCKFQLTNAVGTYTSETNEVRLSEQTQTVTPAACGSGGKFSGTFVLRTESNNVPVLIM